MNNNNILCADNTIRLEPAKPKSIAEYIEAAPAGAREKLHKMHACIRAAAPGATEGLKWGMPSFSYKWILVTFALFKYHIGFYPTPAAVKAFEKNLSEFKTAKGSIQFSTGETTAFVFDP